MDTAQKLKIQLEVIWWVLTVGIAYLVVMPLLNIFTDFQFLYGNVLFVVIFVTYTRYIFLLKHTFLAYLRPVKIFLIVASIPLIFHLVEQISSFQDFMDSEGLLSFEKYFRPEVTAEEKQYVIQYLKREFLFFGVASVITAALMPFRMVLSIWRVYNQKGTV